MGAGALARKWQEYSSPAAEGADLRNSGEDFGFSAVITPAPTRVRVKVDSLTASVINAGRRECPDAFWGNYETDNTGLDSQQRISRRRNIKF